MKRVLAAALLCVAWSAAADVVRTKATSDAAAAAVAAALQAPSDDEIERTAATADHDPVNGTSPCGDRRQRSAGVEVRNPRNHKFVTSNGWTERSQRPRPEINVYSRVEEFPSPPPLPSSQPTVTEAAAFYQQRQRDGVHQQPVVRTAKRIIYYATLPDVVRQPPSPSGYPIDPYAAIGSPAVGRPYSADFRQLYDPNRNAMSDLQRNRLAQSYENAYTTRDGGGRGGSVTSVTSSKSAAAVYDSRYDEPAEFRGDQFYRPPSEFASKFSSWADPFYKSWTSSPSWGDRPLSSSYSDDPRNRIVGPSPFSSWDRESPAGNRLGGGPWNENRGSSWDQNRGSPWDENRGTSWDKELVEVPLKRPDVGNGDNRYRPEVAVVHSGVIDVRGDRRPPPPRFTIVDVDPKPYRQPSSPVRHDADDRDRYEQPQKPTRYEAYTPIQPPVRYEQQYRPPPTSVRYGQQQQQQQQNNDKHSPYYETIKNNINTHQFTTSWTEVSTQSDDVSPNHAASLDVSPSTGSNSTGVHNSNKTAAAAPNTTKTVPPN